MSNNKYIDKKTLREKRVNRKKALSKKQKLPTSHKLFIWDGNKCVSYKYLIGGNNSSLCFRYPNYFTSEILRHPKIYYDFLNAKNVPLYFVYR